jgi:predicted GIY-YIG superfamily endonuclease
MGKEKEIDLTESINPDPEVWYVYFLCSTTSNKTYIGVSNDIYRRLRQHNGEITGGAKYTRQGRPWEIHTVYGPYETMSEACIVEWRAKRFRGAERFVYRKWVAEMDNEAEDKDKHLHRHKSRRKKKKR